MKKISAAFDGLKFSKATLDYAGYLAAKSQALLTGVFLEDFLYHSFNLYDMIGSQGISQAKLKHLIANDKATRQQAIDLFKQYCKKENISYVVHQDESFAINDLLKESIYSDLLLISAAETLNHFQQDKPTPFIKELLAGTQSPVLIVPSAYHSIERIVVLYDGHPSSVFAIKMFNYLFPWLSKLPVEVVFASEEQASAELPDDELIKEFIACHYSRVNYTLLSGEPEKALIGHIQKIPPTSIVIMGAYSRGAVSRMFNSSMANKLMEVLDVPLFIAHNK
jgi:hypothetical protein